MPLFQKQQGDNYRIEIWKLEEEVDDLLSKSALSPTDLKKFESFQSEHRKKEWLCVRMMVQTPHPQPLSEGEGRKHAAIIYDDHGKPHLENSDSKISISHTKDFVGVMISESHHVGVDLERIHPRIEKITHKFLSVNEKKRIPSENRLLYYYIIWGAKEVLYKIYGKEGLLFSENILTDPFEIKDKGMLNAVIHLPDTPEQRFRVHYEFTGDLLLTYSIA